MLSDVSWDALYFIIEDGVLTCESVNYADWSTIYRCYDLESGEWTELDEPAGPLTRFIYRGYDIQGYDTSKRFWNPREKEPGGCIGRCALMASRNACRLEHNRVRRWGAGEGVCGRSGQYR